MGTRDFPIGHHSRWATGYRESFSVLGRCTRYQNGIFQGHTAHHDICVGSSVHIYPRSMWHAVAEHQENLSRKGGTEDQYRSREGRARTERSGEGGVKCGCGVVVVAYG